MDMKTGAIKWSQQPIRTCSIGIAAAAGAVTEAIVREHAGTDVDFGASPILADLGDGRQMIVAGQKSAVMWGFDPDQRGKVIWQTRIGKGGPGGRNPVGNRV